MTYHQVHERFVHVEFSPSGMIYHQVNDRFVHIEFPQLENCVFPGIACTVIVVSLLAKKENDKRGFS
jgi:hypothetical protein